MYMSQLAYKTVAFTLILDPLPSCLESVAERALDALLSISLKSTDRSTDRTTVSLARVPNPFLIITNSPVANEMRPAITLLRETAVVKYASSYCYTAP